MPLDEDQSSVRFGPPSPTLQPSRLVGLRVPGLGLWGF